MSSQVCQILIILIFSMISWIILVAVLEVMMLLNVNRNQTIAEINQLLVCYSYKILVLKYHQLTIQLFKNNSYDTNSILLAV